MAIPHRECYELLTERAEEKLRKDREAEAMRLALLAKEQAVERADREVDRGLRVYLFEMESSVEDFLKNNRKISYRHVFEKPIPGDIGSGLIGRFIDAGWSIDFEQYQGGQGVMVSAITISTPPTHPIAGEAGKPVVSTSMPNSELVATVAANVRAAVAAPKPPERRVPDDSWSGMTEAELNMGVGPEDFGGQDYPDEVIDFAARQEAERRGGH